MDHKRTFLSRLILVLAMLLQWSCIAFAWQDTTSYEDTGVVIERARPLEEVLMEEENAFAEEGDESTRRSSRMANTDWMSTDRNRNYYSQEIKKRELDRKKWEEVTKGINYLDDVHEEKEKQEEEVDEDHEGSGWEGFGRIGLAGGSFIKVLMFALIILALAFILYKMFEGTFVRNTKVGDSKIFTIEDIEERLHESDLDRMLREALQKGEYRLAVRIYYLAIIKELSLKDWIRWKKDKTNREYLNEMIANKPDLYNGFRDATYAFEKVWYGDLDIKEKEYQILSPRFKSFIDNIQRAQ